MFFELYSPFEQFCIFCYTPNFYGTSFITNEVVAFFLILLLLGVFFLSLLNYKNYSFYVKSNGLQTAHENLFLFISDFAEGNIKSKEAGFYIPLIYFLFVIIAVQNVTGLFPYSFTLTTHLFLTLGLSLICFILVNVVGFKKHGLSLFTLIYPAGCPPLLGILLVPIELISYFSKPISLAIRLFANMMSGHILMKVISSFICSLSKSKGIIYFLSYLPFLILFSLFFLEIFISMLQSYIFTVLICIYLHDSINLH